MLLRYIQVGQKPCISTFHHFYFCVIKIRWVFIKVGAKLCRTVALQDRHWPSLAYTNFTTQHPDYMAGVTNAQMLVKELVMPHMKRCLEGSLEAMGRCGIKNKTATTRPQIYIRQKDQSKWKRICQQLVFSVRPVCKEHKPVDVICEACKHWDGNLRWCCTCVILFC